MNAMQNQSESVIQTLFTIANEFIASKQKKQFAFGRTDGPKKKKKKEKKEIETRN